jgi:hypothetical protein
MGSLSHGGAEFRWAALRDVDSIGHAHIDTADLPVVLATQPIDAATESASRPQV